jgi:hypothetical protein
MPDFRRKKHKICSPSNAPMPDLAAPVTAARAPRTFISRPGWATMLPVIVKSPRLVCSPSSSSMDWLMCPRGAKSWWGI